ncbi:MAG: hypothetical protein JW778_05435 [Candidatus Altiarchaeota archaeon]|nr:hypothetical protein [Candidatus Altiarchaeota archaeon]
MTEAVIKESGLDKTSSNLILFLAVVGIISILYLSGFFTTREGIDYSLLTYLPDDGLKSVIYIRAHGDLFQELSSLVGEMLGGRYLRDVKNANMAVVSYEDDSTAYILYLETGKGINELIQAFTKLPLGYSYPDSELEVEEKVVDGKTFYVIKSEGGYSEPLCAWEYSSGVVVMGFQEGYSWSRDSGVRDCTSLLGNSYGAEGFGDFLKEAVDFSEKIGSNRRVYAEGWMSGLESGEDKLIYAFVLGDEVGDYLLFAQNQATSSDFCFEGTVVERDGKEACLKEQSSGYSMIPMASMMVLERGVGDYSVTVMAYSKGIDGDNVRERAVDLIFSVELNGEEKTWRDKKTLTVRVLDYETHDEVYNASVGVYSGYDGELVVVGFTDDVGEVVFEGLPLGSLKLEIAKEGYSEETDYVYYEDTESSVYLKKPCGDGYCGAGENCLNCPSDCGCRSGYVCDDGECEKEPSCGDGLCDEDENCLNCISDCKCKSNFYCDDGGCVEYSPQCGNEVCEIQEELICPEDCSLDPWTQKDTEFWLLRKDYRFFKGDGPGTNCFSGVINVNGIPFDVDNPLLYQASYGIMDLRNDSRVLVPINGSFSEVHLYAQGNIGNTQNNGVTTISVKFNYADLTSFTVSGDIHWDNSAAASYKKDNYKIVHVATGNPCRPDDSWGRNAKMYELRFQNPRDKGIASIEISDSWNDDYPYSVIIAATLKKNRSEDCGDRLCDDDENCLICPQDCGCRSGYICDDGVCRIDTTPREYDVGFDVCNNGLGWSEPESAALNCGWPPGDKGYVRDCCCCYLESHVHDLGSVFNADSNVWIEYRPGQYEGCTSTMYVYYSVGGEDWSLFHTSKVTQETWTPKSTYNKTLTVPGDFRYVKIYIPKCHNDYSSARVLG